MTTDVALAQAPAPPTTLFEGDPEVRLELGRRIANALAPIIERQRLYVVISGRRHVLHEGWSTLAAMVGLYPYVEWTRPTPEGDGWEARVEMRRLDGTPLAAAESECRRDEPTWRDRPSYALRSMAQTRASARAHRLCLGWVMTLAGYEPTPAEEVTDDIPRQPTVARSARQQAAPAQPRRQEPGPGQPGLETAYQRAAYARATRLVPDVDPHTTICAALNLPERGEGAVRRHWLERGRTWQQVHELLEQLQPEVERLRKEGRTPWQALEEAGQRLNAYGQLHPGESITSIFDLVPEEE